MSRAFTPFEQRRRQNAFDARGFGRVTAANFRLMELIEGGVKEATIAQDSNVDLFLFTSDAPAVLVVRSVFVGSCFLGSTLVGSTLDFPEFPLRKSESGATNITIQQAAEAPGAATVCSFGEVSGVAGSFFGFNFTDRALRSTAGGSFKDGNIRGHFVCNSGAVTGEAGLGVDASYNGAALIPATDYTEAIRDAANVIEPADGVRVLVVGVFDVEAP